MQVVQRRLLTVSTPFVWRDEEAAAAAAAGGGRFMLATDANAVSRVVHDWLAQHVQDSG